MKSIKKLSLALTLLSALPCAAQSTTLPQSTLNRVRSMGKSVVESVKNIGTAGKVGAVALGVTTVALAVALSRHLAKNGEERFFHEHTSLIKQDTEQLRNAPSEQLSNDLASSLGKLKEWCEHSKYCKDKVNFVTGNLLDAYRKAHSDNTPKEFIKQPGPIAQGIEPLNVEPNPAKDISDFKPLTVKRDEELGSYDNSPRDEEFIEEPTELPNHANEIKKELQLERMTKLDNAEALLNRLEETIKGLQQRIFKEKRTYYRCRGQAAEN